MRMKKISYDEKGISKCVKVGGNVSFSQSQIGKDTFLVLILNIFFLS